jgi:UDP-N-acetylmuramoyl-L-alanyl-D-glutamate--2,6-diaminopimelate ligase
MTIRNLLGSVPKRHEIEEALASREVAGLDYDSRRLGKDFLFFAFAGQHADGRAFARQALEKGTLAIISELECPAEIDPAVWIQVEHGRRALATASRVFTGAPDDRIGIAAITGTNGKTTTSYVLDSILTIAGKTTALIGTIGYRVAGDLRSAVNTTPESLDLYRILNELEERGGTHATMEVSSHALALGRVHGVHFHTAVFTNLTQDHLDFHGTMEEYFAAKQMLFDRPDLEYAVVNWDDPAGRRLRMNASTKLISYGVSKDASMRACGVESSFHGLRFEIRFEGARIPIESRLTGHINVSNILAACGAARSFGIGWDEIVRGVAACTGVPGRFERVDEGQPFLVVVDYAHTDDALRNTIRVARELGPKRVLTLFGCGGDRDRKKRPLMGSAAGELSDFVVLTSDNPRSEDPLGIINDALVGLRRHDTPHLIEVDREKGIRAIVAEAGAGDIVILAGKGHETYQILQDKRIPFDDRETARRALRSVGYGGAGK